MVAVEKEKKQGFELVKDDKYHPVYADQHGNQHGAYNEDLYDYLRVQLIGRISNLFEIMEEPAELDGYGPIFRLLVADAEKKLERVCELIEMEIGEIEIHALNKGFPWHDDSLPLNVFLKTKEVKAEERRHAEQREAERKDPLKTANSYRSAVAQLLGDLKKDGFNAQSIVKDILAGTLKPIEQYKVNGSVKGAAKDPAIPLTGKKRKGNGKGAAHENG